jgi:hypothetical protein
MSLVKIDRLAKVVNEFREAVHAEAKLIEEKANGESEIADPSERVNQR